MPVLEIGGTHVSGALVELPGCLVLPGSVRRRGLRSEGSTSEVVAGIVGTGDLIDAAPGAAWGVAVPGPFDEAGGVGWFEGVGKLEALHGFDLGAALRSGLRARPSRVSFVNDAVAFALGEWRAGAARGHRRVVCLTLGTGVGSAFLDDGRAVVRGPLVPPDGHAYRLTCDGAPLEDTVSRRALRRRYAEETGDAVADVHTIAERARAGETAARAVVGEAMHALGVTMAPWLDRFGASALVVGGSIAGSWDLLAPALTAGLASASTRPAQALVVEPAHDAECAPLAGAAVHAHAGVG